MNALPFPQQATSFLAPRLGGDISVEPRNGETHQYIYAGGKLLRETISDGTTTKTLDFTYDSVGMPYSLIYSDDTTTSTYYYITNPRVVK